MDRKIYLAIALICIGSFVVLITQIPEFVEGGVLTVDDDGEGDYATIQQALDNATHGDKILIFSGTYNENIVIRKQVTVRGLNCNRTIMNGQPYNHTIRILCDGVNVRNLTLQRDERGSDMSGVYLDADDSEVSGLAITGNEYGVFLFHADGNQVFGNTIEKYRGKGIYLSHSDRNLIHNNEVQDKYYGISLSSSRENIIHNNSLNKCHNGIDLSGSDRNLVSDNVCRDGNYGIVLSYSVECILARNTCDENLIGINIGSCAKTVRYGHISPLNNTVVNNICVKNDEYGILISKSWNVLVFNNSCLENGNAGIRLFRSYSCKIKENRISSNDIGIHHQYDQPEQLEKWNNSFRSNTYERNRVNFSEEFMDYNYSHHQSFIEVVFVLTFLCFLPIGILGGIMMYCDKEIRKRILMGSIYPGCQRYCPTLKASSSRRSSSSPSSLPAQSSSSSPQSSLSSSSQAQSSLSSSSQAQSSLSSSSQAPTSESPSSPASLSPSDRSSSSPHGTNNPDDGSPEERYV